MNTPTSEADWAVAFADRMTLHRPTFTLRLIRTALVPAWGHWTARQKLGPQARSARPLVTLAREFIKNSTVNYVGLGFTEGGKSVVMLIVAIDNLSQTAFV